MWYLIHRRKKYIEFNQRYIKEKKIRGGKSNAFDICWDLFWCVVILFSIRKYIKKRKNSNNTIDREFRNGLQNPSINPPCFSKQKKTKQNKQTTKKKYVVSLWLSVSFSCLPRFRCTIKERRKWRDVKRRTWTWCTLLTRRSLSRESNRSYNIMRSHVTYV